MIYAKTALGLAAMQDRSALTPRQRSAFIMFDGKRDSIEILKMTAGVGVAQSDLDHLVSLGLIASSNPSVQAPLAEPEPSAVVPSTVAAVSSHKADGTPTMSA